MTLTEWPLSHISRSRYYSTSNNSKMVQDRAIVTMADQQKVVHGLLHRAIFNDLEWPQTHISRSDHSLTLNIWKSDNAIASIDILYCCAHRGSSRIVLDEHIFELFAILDDYLLINLCSVDTPWASDSSGYCFMTAGSLLIRRYTSKELLSSDQRSATTMFCLVAWVAVFVCWA